MNNKNIIYQESFHSISKGKNLIIFGKVHGNEPCGFEGIKRVIKKIIDEEISLISGSITFCGIANPQASLENKRFIDENLARIFDIYDKPDSYEKKLSTILASFIESKDAILDIHSGNAEGSKFVFQDYEKDEYYNLANALGFDMVVHGRSSIYGGKRGGDITSYAYKFNIPSVVVECGQHNDPKAIDVAEKSILRFMNHYGLIDHPLEESVLLEPMHLIMQKLYFMEYEGKLSKNWKHGDFLQKGEVIANYKNGEKIITDDDYYIILPKTFAKVGDEWFYLSKKM